MLDQPEQTRTSVPHRDTFVDAARTCDTVVCLPTYNEGETIGPLIDAILRLPVATDIVILDDGSPDRTRAEVEVRAAADPRVGLIGRPRKLGIGTAHRLAWLHARRLGYARIVTLDAASRSEGVERPDQALEFLVLPALLTMVGMQPRDNDG